MQEKWLIQTKRADFNKIAEKFMKSHGASPAQKGYNPGIKGVPPFPCSICTSINDEV